MDKNAGIQTEHLQLQVTDFGDIDAISVQKYNMTHVF